MPFKAAPPQVWLNIGIQCHAKQRGPRECVLVATNLYECEVSVCVCVRVCVCVCLRMFVCSMVCVCVCVEVLHSCDTEWKNIHGDGARVGVGTAGMRGGKLLLTTHFLTHKDNDVQ